MDTPITPELRAECAPGGTLRVALNLSNFLLVTSAAEGAEPVGIAPDIGREIARRLGLPLQFVRYPNPGALAADAAQDRWDVGLIGADPLRAAEIAFTSAYLEIEASYLVPAGSPLQTLADVDRPGVRIAVGDKTAYDMYLRRTLQHASLHRAQGLDASHDLWVAQGLDALAGLRPRLLLDQARHPGSRILDGRFTAVQQAIGVPIARQATARWLQAFAAEARQGLVAALIARHGVQGVSVAAGLGAADGA
jgi:polar amino acid transport system substrate-binding protein